MHNCKFDFLILHTQTYIMYIFISKEICLQRYHLIKATHSRAKCVRREEPRVTEAAAVCQQVLDGWAVSYFVSCAHKQTAAVIVVICGGKNLGSSEMYDS